MATSGLARDLHRDIMDGLRGEYSLDFDVDAMMSINNAALLHLREIEHSDTEFGFVLRHYWRPASELTYQQFSLIKPSSCGEETVLLRANVTRRPVRCEAGRHVWREKSVTFTGQSPSSEVLETQSGEEELCCYDRYEQAYRTRGLSSRHTPHPDDLEQARRQALYALPFIVPPGPVALGSKWHGRAGCDVMNYELVSSEKVGEMTVVFIQRHGWYTSLIPESEDEDLHPVITERKGLTGFALHRSVVLEDRIVDRVVEASPELGCCIGTRSLVMTRLLQSCPCSGY